MSPVVPRRVVASVRAIEAEPPHAVVLARINLVADAVLRSLSAEVRERDPAVDAEDRLGCMIAPILAALTRARAIAHAEERMPLGDADVAAKGAMGAADHQAR
jgi:hypothetical protein